MKWMKRFGKQGKISPCFIVPYEIVGHFVKVAYELDFPVDLAAVHLVFFVSFLKKCIGDPAMVIPLENMGVKDSMSYEEVNIEILDLWVHRLRKKEVILVKLLFQNQSVGGATQEAEANIMTKYPYLFPSNSVLE